MALEMAGQNTTGFEKKTLKLGSPRFMSIMPEQEEDSLVRKSLEILDITFFWSSSKFSFLRIFFLSNFAYFADIFRIDYIDWFL